MKVVQSDMASMATRGIRGEERIALNAWYKHLEDWETDEYIRDNSKPLPSDPAVRVLWTNAGYVIFFTVEKDRIVIMDVARKETIELFRKSSEKVRA